MTAEEPPVTPEEDEAWHERLRAEARQLLGSFDTLPIKPPDIEGRRRIGAAIARARGQSIRASQVALNMIVDVPPRERRED